ncbi:MAG: co-chaperone YbbN [Pseudomonadota bacterium]|nr:co-chaperone YbbN [Pseudomonadota bacterium]
MTTATFMAEVVETSRTTPVLADFWATWCGPCKALGPLLEKVVAGTKGAVRMVKIDIDRNPDLAQQLRIQSVPTVYAFFQGRVVDGFSGALPESQIRQFVDRLVQMAGGSAAGQGGEEREILLARAKQALDGGDTHQAAALYNHLLSADPADAGAFFGLVRVMIASGEAEAARQMLERAPEDMQKKPEAASVRALLDLAEHNGARGREGELAARLAANPADHQARFDLAMAHYQAGRREEAVDELLELFRRDRKWNDELARKQLLKLFDAFGPADELTVSGRRRLSSILFS